MWEADATRRAVVGAGHRDGRPGVLLHHVAPLTVWSYVGSLLDAADPVAARIAASAAAWECPALVPAGDGRWILLVSLWRGEITYRSANLVGELRESGSGLRFVPGTGGVLDRGPGFYGAATLVEDDRTPLRGWGRESRTEQESVEAGQAGCLTYPSEMVSIRTACCFRPRRTS